MADAYSGVNRNRRVKPANKGATVSAVAETGAGGKAVSAVAKRSSQPSTMPVRTRKVARPTKTKTK